jgi:hypothetical protein
MARSAMRKPGEVMTMLVEIDRDTGRARGDQLWILKGLINPCTTTPLHSGSI